MIQIYTGNGKGKTTAALGLIIRALGCNKKVALVQFMKKNYQYSEINFLKDKPNIDIFQFGTAELVNPDNPSQIDFDEAEKAIKKCKTILKKQLYDLIVIDEINVAVKWDLLSLEKQLSLMRYDAEMEIVMTGRYAAAEVIEQADLVTEMKEIKHYFKKGVKARKGFEF